MFFIGHHRQHRVMGNIYCTGVIKDRVPLLAHPSRVSSFKNSTIPHRNHTASAQPNPVATHPTRTEALRNTNLLDSTENKRKGSPFNEKISMYTAYLNICILDYHRVGACRQSVYTTNVFYIHEFIAKTSKATVHPRKRNNQCSMQPHWNMNLVY